MNESTEDPRFGVAKPCPVEWDEMVGDERVRRCGQCKTDVFNIAEMTTAEAQKLVETHEGKLCIQIFQREDGTVKTKDCDRPVGRAIAVRGLIAVVPPRALGRSPAAPTLLDRIGQGGRPTAVEVAIAAVVLVPVGVMIWWLLTR